MKHIKLFEEAYSEIPTMSTDQIKNMSMADLLMTLKKLAMKGATAEFSSVARIYAQSHSELLKSKDYVEKIGSIMREYNIVNDTIPGVPSEEELNGLTRDYYINRPEEIKQKKMEMEEERKKIITDRAMELEGIAKRISTFASIRSEEYKLNTLQRAKDILEEIEKIESTPKGVILSHNSPFGL